MALRVRGTDEGIRKVILGENVETGKDFKISDLERRSGLYTFGIQGSGKTNFLKSLIVQDILNDHGVFFLDPHGDAIDDLLKHIPKERENDVIVVDPSDPEYAFGMNPLACPDPNDINERSWTWAQAIDIFTKLYADPQKDELDILLSQYLPNSFLPLIAHQGYTLCEVPLFLRDKHARDRLLRHPVIANHYHEVVDFWHDTFDRKRPDKQDEEIESTLRRIQRFLTHEYTKHIIGCAQTTLNFTDIMDNRTILFVKLTDALPPDVWKIIGTMLVSNLVRAVRRRETVPYEERVHFCVFVDEFQNFSSSEDFAFLFTEGRKYKVATCFAHQERFGQLADNKRIAGATLTAATIVCFRQTPLDAPVLAPAYAQPSPTEIRRERTLIISQTPVEDILKGHANPQVQAFVTEYLRSLFYRMEDARAAMEREGIHRQQYQEASSLMQMQAQLIREDLSTSVAWRRNATLAALGAARYYQLGAAAKTDELLQLFESTQALRQVMRCLDSFLTGVMEGSVAKGQEAYVRSLLEIVAVFFPISQTIALYVALEYGDSSMSRSIPLALARGAGVFRSEIAGLVTQAEDRKTRERRALQERYRAEDAKPITDADPRSDWGRDEKRKMEKLREQMETSISKLIVKHRFEVTYFWHIARLYTEFIWLECFPGLRSLLSPYSNARFTEESQRLSRSVDTPYDVERLIRDIAQKFERSSANSDHLRYMRGDYISKLLTFLRTHKEGAFVILALLDAARTNRGWRALGFQYPPELRGSLNMCMIDFPGIQGLDPLEMLRLIQRINAFKRNAQQDFPAFLDCFLRYFGWLPKRPLSKFQSFVGIRQERVPSAREYLAAMTTWDIAQYGKFHIDDIQPLDTEGLIQSFERRLNRDDPRPEASVLKSTITSMGETFSLLYPQAARVWSGADELTRSYLIARACDLACLGEQAANATFPLPRVSGADAFVCAVVPIVQDIITRPLREQMSKDEARWRNRRQEELTTALARISYAPPETLPARAPGAPERTALKNACLAALSDSSVLTVVTDVVNLCDLLARPENHVKVPSNQYTETQVDTYTPNVMADKMARELMELSIGVAYVKSTGTCKIHTLDVSQEAVLDRLAEGRKFIDAHSIARKNAIQDRILILRSEIEEKIRKRQQAWRRPGNEPPPTTGGDRPASLPSGGARQDLPAGRQDREGPPPRSIPRKPSTPPEEKPPKSGNLAPARGRIVDFISYRQ